MDGNHEKHDLGVLLQATHMGCVGRFKPNRPQKPEEFWNLHLTCFVLYMET